MFKEAEMLKTVIDSVIRPMTAALQQLADAQSLSALQLTRANDLQERTTKALEKLAEGQSELLSTEKTEKPN